MLVYGIGWDRINGAIMGTMSGDEESPTDRADFSALDGFGRALGTFAQSGRVSLYLASFGLIAIAWAIFAAMAARIARAVPGIVLGPGGDLAQWLPDMPVPSWIASFVALCLSPAPVVDGPEYVLAAIGMWFLMAIAMMLPSALPMIGTYCEIADTAALKGDRVVHPVVLLCGYLSVWLAMSAAFGLAWALANRFFTPDGSFAPFAAVPAAAALGVAGVYQFSGLKEACLTKCRNPFATLFSNWSTRPLAIFRLGIRQGIWCVGCCWALMLVMFAVGTMNLLWMALLAMLAIAEKAQAGHFVTRIAGAILLVWAAALLLLSA